jgi:hypothetical protein
MGLFLWLVFFPLATLTPSLQMMSVILLEGLAIGVMSLILIRRSDYFYHQLTI